MHVQLHSLAYTLKKITCISLGQIPLAYEHVILFVKLLAHYFIPETPEDVKVAIAKERYEKRYGYNKPANVPIDTDILRKFHIF